MLFSRKSKSLFEGVPGPSPWYLTPKTVAVGEYTWQPAGKSDVSSGMTLLVGPHGPVALLDFYNYVLPLDDSSLLIWHQPQTDGPSTADVRLFVLRPDRLLPLGSMSEALCERMKREQTAILFHGEVSADLRLSTSNAGDELHTDFPEPLLAIPELLILCKSSGVESSPGWERSNLALLVAWPPESRYRLYPQDWFNQDGRDYGYEWVTRVARDPKTRQVHGEGIRISPFILDESLRSLRR
jgi:hypothetical protein